MEATFWNLRQEQRLNMCEHELTLFPSLFFGGVSGGQGRWVGRHLVWGLMVSAVFLVLEHRTKGLGLWSQFPPCNSGHSVRTVEICHMGQQWE